MGRSSKKGPYVDQRLLKKLAGLSAKGGPASGGKPTIIKTWSRASEISPEMVGHILSVHNGKDFITVRIAEEMVGHRLGEFAPTRKFVRHGGKIQKEIEQKAAQTQKGTQQEPAKK